jgi:hypothetical protein
VAQLLAELRGCKREPEVIYGLPYGDVEECAATGDPAVQLGGDVARLTFEVQGVLRPRREELVHVFGVDVELVDEQDRATAILDLTGQRYGSLGYVLLLVWAEGYSRWYLGSPRPNCLTGSQHHSLVGLAQPLAPTLAVKASVVIRGGALGA